MPLVASATKALRSVYFSIIDCVCNAWRSTKIGVLLCWNDHIRPWDEGTIWASCSTYHSCQEENFLLKVFLNLTVASFSLPFAFCFLNSTMILCWMYDEQLFGAINWKALNVSVSPLCCLIYFLFKVKGGVLAVSVSHWCGYS